MDTQKRLTMKIIPVLSFLSLAPLVFAQGAKNEVGLDQFAVTIFRGKDGMAVIGAVPRLIGMLSGDGSQNSPYVVTWSFPKPESDVCRDEFEGNGVVGGVIKIDCAKLRPSAREALAKAVGVIPAKEYLDRLHKEQQADIDKLPTTLQGLVNGAIQNDALAKDRIANAVLQVQKQIRDSLVAEKGVEIATLKKEIEQLKKKLEDMADLQERMRVVEGKLSSQGQSAQGPPAVAPKPAPAKPKGD